MTDHDDPTATATRAAAGQLIAANAAAHHAPRDPASLYARTGALYDLLLHLGKTIADLRKLASSLAMDPPDGLFSDDGQDPRAHLIEIVGRLDAAAQHVRRSREQVDPAWQGASHLGVEPGRHR